MNRTGKAIDRVIRILIAKRKKLTSELILATLAGQPGLEIVGESEEADISNRVAKTLPNLLVISLDELGKCPGLGGTILREHPKMRIIAVSSEPSRPLVTGPLSMSIAMRSNLLRRGTSKRGAAQIRRMGDFLASGGGRR